MTKILLAHAPEATDRADFVAEQLASLGFQVAREPGLGGSPFARRRLISNIDQAACVLLLWSKAAADAPALKAAAARAHAAGKLALARLDHSALPGRAGWRNVADLSSWQGLDGHRGWAKLVSALRVKAAPRSASPAAMRSAPASRPAPVAASALEAPAPKRGGAGALIALLVLLALAGAGAAAYLFLM